MGALSNNDCWNLCQGMTPVLSLLLIEYLETLCDVILDRIKTLHPSTPKVPIWFVLGTRDVICPYRYAQWLGEALRPAEGTNLLSEGAFVQGGHSSSKNPGVKKSEYGFVQVIREEWEAGFLHRVMPTA